MENNWLDTKKELPIEWHPVLLWLKSGCAIGHMDGDIWRDVFGYPVEEEVMAWQPFPFGPNGEALVSDVIKYWE